MFKKIYSIGKERKATTSISVSKQESMCRYRYKYYEIL